MREITRIPPTLHQQGLIAYECSHCGHLTSDLKSFAEKTENTLAKTVMAVLYYVCPNLDLLNVKGQAASGIPVEWGYQATATAYGLVYVGLLLTGACLIFQRRDF